MIVWGIGLALWAALLVWFPKVPYASLADVEFLPIIQSIRTAFEKTNVGASGDAQALVSGLSIGDDLKLSESTQMAMQTVGLSHLTAVSGANCAIVIALVYLALNRLSISRLIRAGLASAALVCYVLLVGPEPSVLRSATMTLVVLWAVAAGRQNSALSALGACVVILLVADPKLSASLGFALSVSATVGILVLAPKVSEFLSKQLPAWLSIPMAVSFSAQIACWPVLLFIQEGVSTYSLFANLLVEPLVAPITILGLLACLLAIPFPLIAQALCWMASLFAWPIAAVANYFYDQPFSTLLWPGGLTGVVAAGTVVALVVYFFRSVNLRRRRITLAAILAVGAVFFGSNSAVVTRTVTWARGDWNVVACDVGQGDALVIRDAGVIALIDVGKTPKLIDQCLDELGISRIDLLVLTHYDFDHVGGLGGAISNRKVGAALLTAFRDDRPAKLEIDQALLSKNIPIHRASIGQHGSLGGLQWRVLNADSIGVHPEDSNDASTVMHFAGTEFDLLTMADSGERAQQRIARHLGNWVARKSPLILKVSHHGSADQYAELTEALRPSFSIVSVGAKNSYGHPTDRTLALLRRVGSKVLRTDFLGSIAIDTSTSAEGQITVKLLASG